jgi:hypothetical protein
LQGSFSNASKDVIDSIDEPQTQAGLLLFVPRCSGLDIRLRLRPDDPPPRHWIR